MKIAYIFGGLELGGAEVLMLDIMRQWKVASFEMIGIHRKGGLLKDQFYSAGPQMFSHYLCKWNYLAYLITLRKIIRKEYIDQIHTQMWIDCIHCKLATIGLRIPIINTFHGFYPLTGFYGLLCKWSMRLADKLIFVSDYEKQYYQKHIHLDSRKLFVAHNGIDFSKVDRQIIESSTAIISTSDHVKICMVGSFSYSRDQLTICRALTKIKTPVDFYFIGAENKMKSNAYQECYDYCVDNNLRDKVHFVGQQENVYQWLKEMDGFIYSTKHDTFGIAVVEAMACGLPVVVSDWEVLKEVCSVSEYPAVRYFVMGDADDCAKQIEELVQTIEESQMSSMNKKQIVRERYSIQSLVTHLYEIYTL